MKKLKKMSLANIQGKLTRKEMKNIMAGSGTNYMCCGSSGNCSCRNYTAESGIPTCGNGAPPQPC